MTRRQSISWNLTMSTQNDQDERSVHPSPATSSDQPRAAMSTPTPTNKKIDLGEWSRLHKERSIRRRDNQTEYPSGSSVNDRHDGDISRVHSRPSRSSVYDEGSTRESNKGRRRLEVLTTVSFTAAMNRNFLIGTPTPGLLETTLITAKAISGGPRRLARIRLKPTGMADSPDPWSISTHLPEPERSTVTSRV